MFAKEKRDTYRLACLCAYGRCLLFECTPRTKVKLNTHLSVAQLLDASLALERTGEMGAALQHAQAALEEARIAGNSETVATALNRIAFVHFRLGHYEQARALAQQSRTCTLSDSPACAEALLILGNCAAETDALTDAETFYRDAADMSRMIGCHRTRARALHGLGQGVFMPRGQFDLALAADEEAYQIACQQDWREWMPYPLTTLAWIYQITGQCQRARTFLNTLHQVVLPGSLHQGYHDYLTANLALDEGDAQSAPPLYASALSIAEAIGEPGLNVEARLGMSYYYRAVQDGATARMWAEDALACAIRVGYRHAQGKALVERGRAAWLSGDASAAEADLRAAIRVLTPLQANYDLANAHLLLATLLHQRGHPEADTAWHQAILRIINGGYAFLVERERVQVFPLVAHHLASANSHPRTIALTLLDHLQRIPPPSLRIATLGTFEVWQGKRQVAPRALGKRRARDLLALLLVAPAHTLSFDQVADALWRDKAPSAAQALFHQATSALRRALEPELPDKFPSRYVQVEEGQITLHLPPGSTVDFQEFEARCHAEQWEAALALYRGDLFPDNRYAEWAIAPREHFKRLYLRALLVTVHRQMNAGHAREALETCHRILEIDPWQEDAVWLGMRACLVFNDRAGALRLYRDLERTLREELNTSPQAELQELYQSLLCPPES